MRPLKQRIVDAGDKADHNRRATYVGKLFPVGYPGNQDNHRYRHDPLGASRLLAGIVHYRLLVVIMLVMVSFISNTQANVLKDHPSPYLALHGNDPVDWMPWGREALEKARQEDKLIFVSVGYYSCHWCHVMQRESFSSREVARLLNRSFVSIKIDRELNPALDDRLMDFVRATSGRGGWPLNVFLTPDGYPIVGFTYLPPARFSRVLEDLQQRWKDDRKALRAAVRDVEAELAKQRKDDNQLVERGRPLSEWRESLLQSLMLTADTLKGGFGDQAKFPSVPQLWALLALGEDEEIHHFLRLTLDTMAKSGLRDQIGGGFFRYTVDPDWETPHYEKMLYTNALLAMIYARAAGQFDNPAYREMALDTLRFMNREMRAPGGAYIASLSAVDDHNVEGGYYLWTQKQLGRLLDQQELDLVNVGWAMNRRGDDDAELLPLETVEPALLAQQFDLSEAELKRKMEVIRTKLETARRNSRSLPRDDKRLTAWNAMALLALSEVADVGQMRQRGTELYDFIRGKLVRDGHVVHAVDSTAGAMGEGDLADYAWTSLAFIRWGTAVDDQHALKLGRRLVEEAWRRFHFPQGWLATETTLLPDPLYQRHIPDGALPSAEAMLLRATVLHLGETPDADLEKQVKKMLTAPTRGMEEGLYWYASLISAAVFADRHGLDLKK